MNFKKILATVLSVAMVLSLMSIPAFAAVPVATLNGVDYNTAKDAVDAAADGDIIEILAATSIDEALIIDKSLIFEGATVATNGNVTIADGVSLAAPNFSGDIAAEADATVCIDAEKASLSALGNITFTGDNKVNAFSAGYYNRTITIGADATLNIVGSGRMTIGWGNTFVIEGNITDALTADKSTLVPSLRVAGGCSITGSGATIDADNAYILFGMATTTKNSVATDKFEFDFNNCILDTNGTKIQFAEPTSGKTPEYIVNYKDSKVNVYNYEIAAANSKTVLDNSVFTASNNFRNSGDFLLKNGAELNIGNMIQFGENGGNNGTITVDNSTLNIPLCSSPMDGRNTGKLIVKNNGKATVQKIIDTEVSVDASSSLTSDKISGNSPITIDTTNLSAGKVLDLKEGASREGNVTITVPVSGDAGKIVYSDDGDIEIIVYVVKNTTKDELYESFEEALANADAGDTIAILGDTADFDATINKDIVLDLGGNKLTDAYIKVTADVEIKNGDIENPTESYPLVAQNGGNLTVTDVDITASNTDRAIWVRDNSSLTFNSGSILVQEEENVSTPNISAIYVNKNTSVTVNGGTITVDAPYEKAIAIFGNYENADVTVNGGKISTSGSVNSYGIQADGDITFNDGELVTNEKVYTTGNTKGITNGSNYAFVSRNGNITVAGGKVTTNGSKGYIVYPGNSNASSEQIITITGGEFANNLTETDKTAGGHKAPELIKTYSPSKVTATVSEGLFKGFSENLVSGNNASLKISGGTYDVNPEKYLVDGLASSQNYNDTFSVVSKTEAPVSLEVLLKGTGVKGVYDVVVQGDGFINELSTAKLVFENNSVDAEGNKLGYTLKAADGYTFIKEAADSYTFHAVSGTVMTNDTLFVKIGEISFKGFGTADFKVNASAENRVIIKTEIGNAELLYGAASDTLDAFGDLIVDEDAAINEKVMPEMAELTIEVDYVHDIAEVAKDYQNMTIEITGLDLLGEVITIDLGNDQADFDYEYVECDDYNKESKVAHHKSIVKVADKLIKGNTYNVKIYGDGYRTAEYTIRMDDDKTMKFWNNAMSAVTKVEVDDDEPTDVNFLAGDIFEDEIINVYDLSAIVSYFGEDPTANAAYIQYDLNRDGLINGIDISILLNSWYK